MGRRHSRLAAAVASLDTLYERRLRRELLRTFAAVRRFAFCLGVALAFFFGCTGDSISTEEGAVQAVVRGTVRGPNGVGVAGVTAMARVFRSGQCGSGQEPGTFPSVATLSSGEFLRVLVVPLSAAFTGCVEVQFTPPASSGLR